MRKLDFFTFDNLMIHTSNFSGDRHPRWNGRNNILIT